MIVLKHYFCGIDGMYVQQSIIVLQSDRDNCLSICCKMFWKVQELRWALRAKYVKFPVKQGL